MMEYIEQEEQHIKTAKTAVILAVISMGSAILSTIIFPLVLSPIAIIFATLSKGKTKAYSIQAKVAFTLAILALVLDIFVGAFAVYNVFFNDKYTEVLNETWEEYYGMTFDEYKDALIREITGQTELSTDIQGDVDETTTDSQSSDDATTDSLGNTDETPVILQ